MSLYFHATSPERAEAILRDGFRDGDGYYLTADLHSGVWISDAPLDVNEGLRGSVLLSVKVRDDLVNPREWVREPEEHGELAQIAAYREFLVPATLLNERAVVPRWSDESISPTQLCLKLTACREAKGLTIAALAEQAWLPTDYLGRVESGQMRPDIHTVCRLAKVLGVPVTELLGVRTPPSPEEEGGGPMDKSLSGLGVLDLLGTAGFKSSPGDRIVRHQDHRYPVTELLRQGLVETYQAYPEETCVQGR